MDLMSELPLRSLLLPQKPQLLCSFDFDDTLFSFTGSAAERREFFEIMRRLRIDCGALWGINTGRAPDYLREGLLDFFHDAPDGFAPDFTVTMERHVHLAGADGTLQPAHEWNRQCIAAHDDLFCDYGAMLDELLHRLESDFSALELRRQQNDAYSLVVNDPRGLDEVSRIIMAAIAPYPAIVTQRAGPYLRFSHRDYNKGTALAYVASCFGIPAAQVAVFGDGHNDLDAMNTIPAAYRACPSNAADEVKALVLAGRGYLSQSPRTAGVLDALKHGVIPHFGLQI